MRFLRRLGGRTIFSNPISMIVTVVVVLAVAAYIVWENVKESQAAEQERAADRSRNGSIWND